MCLVSPQNEPVKKDGLSVQILFFAKELSIINLCINNLSIVPNNLFTHSETLTSLLDFLGNSKISLQL